jgi:hypothetical protein
LNGKVANPEKALLRRKLGNVELMRKLGKRDFDETSMGSVALLLGKLGKRDFAETSMGSIGTLAEKIPQRIVCR